MTKEMMAAEAKEHLLRDIIPFWRGLRDDEFGGYYGWMDYDLVVNLEAMKGCILNSRITWFFSNVYIAYKLGKISDADFAQFGYSAEDVKKEAEHGYFFLKNRCIDRENGGIYWSMTYDGRPDDTIKHTYNQAFCIYALASYYDAFGEAEAIELASDLYHLIEEKCTDEIGYLEAFTVDFKPESNEKLSENGVMAEKTMNTLLHVFEAYTEFVRVTEYAKTDSEDAFISWLAKEHDAVRDRLKWIMDVFAEKIYNPDLHRQEVFFDREYHSIIDLYSYGHDIETAWLMDRGCDVLADPEYTERMQAITRDLTANVYRVAFNGTSLANECDQGVVNEHRIWWVQAESVLGFINGYEHTPEHEEYLAAATAQWEFIRDKVFDHRVGSEWYWEVDADGNPYPDRPIVEQWKCPYHNGRMCLELIKRILN